MTDSTDKNDQFHTGPMKWVGLWSYKLFSELNLRSWGETSQKALEDRTNSSWFQMLLSISKYVDANVSRDAQHASLMGYWVKPVAYQLGFNGEGIQDIYYAALFHDIGKIAVSTQVLTKPGSLTIDEWSVMKLHPVVGANIIKACPELAHIAPYIYFHQEKFDGSGYPDGLNGDEIPMGARLLAVLDAYEAMTSDRYYRKAPGHEYAVQELRGQSGQQFDKIVVETFLDVLDWL
jgi:HD-GYP domain-containing protein (c-di-GMP phosphodiesterase class II)